MIGKWHLHSNPVGFDFWRILPGQGSYYNPHFIEMDGSRNQYTGHCNDKVTEFAIDWLCFSLFGEKRMKIKESVLEKHQKELELRAKVLEAKKKDASK